MIDVTRSDHRFIICPKKIETILKKSTMYRYCRRPTASMFAASKSSKAVFIGSSVNHCLVEVKAP